MFFFSICWSESDFLQDVKLEQHTKDENIDGPAQFFPLDVDHTQKNLKKNLRVDENPLDADQRTQSLPQHFPRKIRLKYGSPWRLRLDYLVAYGPPDNPHCYCMVCSEHLPVPRVSSFRKHIQACHPETSGLSRNERDAVIRAWTKRENIDSAMPKEDGKYKFKVTATSVAYMALIHLELKYFYLTSPWTKVFLFDIWHCPMPVW